MEVVNAETLRHIELFSSIKQESIDELLECMRVAKYKKGCYIFRDKELIDQVFIVLSGKVSIYKLSEVGEKRVIFILDKGHLLNDNLTNQLPCAIDCECFEASTILICSKEKFIKIMENDFALTQAVINQYCSKLRRTYRQLKNAPTNIAMERKLAAKLYRLCRDYGVQIDQGYLIDLPLTVSYLSQLLGAQRETVSRALKKLIAANLVEYENKKIKVISIEALGAYHKNI